jgi:cephalosporin hydroxylase
MNDVIFPAYFKTLNFNKKSVDFVFIDTSHEYEHTLQEITAFSSILSDTGILSFHDSNVAIAHPVRINGTTCPSGLNNPKGVTDGLKTYFNIAFDESKYCNIMVEKDGYLWNLINYPYCYGLAVVKRIKRIEQ